MNRLAILFLLSAVCSQQLFGAEPVPPSTAYTRGLLRAPDSAHARDVLGISNFVFVTISGGTNGAFGDVLTNNRSAQTTLANKLLLTNSPFHMQVLGADVFKVDTSGRVIGVHFYGDGLGLSNAVDLVAGGTNVTVTPSAGNRSWTIAVTAGLNGTNGANGTNGVVFPLTDSTVIGTNGTGGGERSISFIKDWNSGTNLALSFGFNALRNDFYQDPVRTHFNTYGGANFKFDQGLVIDADLTVSTDLALLSPPYQATIGPNNHFLFWNDSTKKVNVPTSLFPYWPSFADLGINTMTNLAGKTIEDIGLWSSLVNPPDTVAWSAGAVTLGWPTLYSTHSITSNSWVTGFAGGIAGKTLTAFVTITNATATDYTLSVSNSVTSTDGLRSWNVTNKTSRGFSFKVGAQTNAASQPFF